MKMAKHCVSVNKLFQSKASVNVLQGEIYI